MAFATSNKAMVRLVAEVCLSHGIAQVVISPGSRNAPLTLAFASCPSFKCHSVIDERSAGFFALGMARQLQQPVLLICTSGTATLNYSPAIAEAFYQHIPLIVLTADRPPELIGKEDGQTILQVGIYQNFVAHSLNLPASELVTDLDFARQQLFAALSDTLTQRFQPVHVNIALREPLYDTFEIEAYNISKTVLNPAKPPQYDLAQLTAEWNAAEKILVVVGCQWPDDLLNERLVDFCSKKNVVLLAASTSNIESAQTVFNIDKTIKALSHDQKNKFAPQLLITFGGPIVSKPLKQYLREFKPKYHWDIDPYPEKVDAFDVLTQQITGNPAEVIFKIQEALAPKPNLYLSLWNAHHAIINDWQRWYLSQLAWCDLDVLATLQTKLKSPIDVHLANSTPVRYIEFFSKLPHVNYLTNRGTSGIDGCTSTAVGAAMASGKPTLLITGDISFIYDSNALFNNQLPNNLRILVINNNGGNIFRVIPGPDKSGKLSYFETPNQVSIKHLCKAYGVWYLQAHSNTELEHALPLFLNPNRKITVLEVFTPAEISAKCYREYLTQIVD